jgi:hypothetical protein
MTRNVVGDYRKFVGVPNGVQNAVSDGSGDHGDYNSMETKNIVVLISQFVFEVFLGSDSFEYELKVEREGGIILALVNNVENMIFVLNETFNEEGGSDKGFSVENGGVHDKRRVGLLRKLFGLIANLDNCLKNYCKFFLLL